MAYRIKTFENMSVAQVDDIFRRGRGLMGTDAPRQYDEANALIPGGARQRDTLPMHQAEVVDEELELVR